MPEAEIQTYAELLASVPEPGYHVSLDELRAAVEANRRKVVVLDDDPTGCQTVHDTLVLTVWDVASLAEALADRRRVFYIITNSRSVSEAEAVEINRQIVANLAVAAARTGADVAIVSRSDSTLRGHYPAETDALREALEAHFGYRINGTLIIPFFLEGGRLTAHDVHWVCQGDRVLPAAQSESAQDPAFGYRHSNLREWVEEKTEGRVRADDVVSISLEDIRIGGADKVAARLRGMGAGGVAVVNALTYADMDLFVLGLMRAEAGGSRYLYRTAASFVRSRAALGSRPLLTRQELLPGIPRPAPGLVIVGSFVPRSTGQLYRLLELDGVCGIELRVVDVVEGQMREPEIRRVVSAAEEALRWGQVPVVYTTRRLLAESKEGSVRIGQQVACALVEVVKRISLAPKWIIGKGGITAHDIAVQALGARRSFTPGQISPGVPIWVLGEETRFPGLPYVVFPGNVGQPDTLAAVVRLLRG